MFRETHTGLPLQHLDAGRQILFWGCWWTTGDPVICAAGPAASTRHLGQREITYHSRGWSESM